MGELSGEVLNGGDISSWDAFDGTDTMRDISLFNTHVSFSFPVICVMRTFKILGWLAFFGVKLGHFSVDERKNRYYSLFPALDDADGDGVPNESDVRGKNISLENHAKLHAYCVLSRHVHLIHPTTRTATVFVTVMTAVLLTSQMILITMEHAILETAVPPILRRLTQAFVAVGLPIQGIRI